MQTILNELFDQYNRFVPHTESCRKLRTHTNNSARA